MRLVSGHPETLLSVSSESEAASIASALGVYDIETLTVGGDASGFSGHIPGMAAVVVNRADFDRAKQAMTEIRAQGTDIDWSKVHVTETPETPRMAVCVDTLLSMLTLHIWWMLEFMCIGLGLIQWWYTGNLSNELIYLFAALALVGLFLALVPLRDRRPKVRSFAVSLE